MICLKCGMPTMQYEVDFTEDDYSYSHVRYNHCCLCGMLHYLPTAEKPIKKGRKINKHKLAWQKKRGEL